MYKSRVFLVVRAGLLSLAILPPHPAAAAWPTDPLVNVPLCTAAAGQTYPRSVPDGAGGAIVAWRDIGTRHRLRPSFADRGPSRRFEPGSVFSGFAPS
jgi:hypothetical protein